MQIKDIKSRASKAGALFRCSKTGRDGMELTILISLLSGLVGIIIGIATFNRNRDKDVKQDAARQAVMETKLDAISSGVLTIQVDLKAHEKKWDDMDTRLVRVEESSKSAHKRIDSLTGVKYREEELQR